MNRTSLLIAFALASIQQQAAAQRADSIPNDSYLDAAAAEHVRLARERRQVADLSVESYKALTKERISAGLRGFRRDRLLYRREVAGRIEWTREGPARIEVLGARESVPVAMKGVQLPKDLGSFMPHLAFDPADNRMLIGWDDNEFVRHPFAAGAERYYKFRTGGTTTIHLPDARVVRLIELEILPRSSDHHNISGSFWLDAETHAVVQAAFRLAREIDIIEAEKEEDDGGEGIPRFLRPMTAAVDYVTVEYGLYDLKWWLPRTVLMEGHVRVGPMRMPLQYERTYSGYEVTGLARPLTAPIAEVLRRDSARANEEKCNQRGQISVDVGEKTRNPDRTGSTEKTITTCGRWEIVMSADTAAILESAELPASIFATGEQLVSESELREIGERIEKLGGGPALLPRPVTSLSLLSPAHARYNRIEALSLAAQGAVDFGAYRGFAQARLGVADLEPNFELAVEKIGESSTLTIGGYRRLNAFDPFVRPFTPGSSLSALLFGSDDADYYRTLGIELRAQPGGSVSNWYSARIFAQRESAARKETDFSLRHLVDSGHEFRENLPAEKLNAYGGELSLRFARGLDPEGFRIGGDLYGHGATGSADFARTAATLRVGVPLPGAFAGALEAAAGVTSVGAPIQHLWYIGGAHTVRGYEAGTLAGETFWRGRAEIAYGLPAVRLVAFSDAGWAGVRDDFRSGKPLLSVGAGISFLDGIVRFDVARGLRDPKGWTTTLYFDAAL